MKVHLFPGQKTWEKGVVYFINDNIFPAYLLGLDVASRKRDQVDQCFSNTGTYHV